MKYGGNSVTENYKPHPIDVLVYVIKALKPVPLYPKGTAINRRIRARINN